MTEITPVLGLQPGDVAHIETHTCHGMPVNCGTHDIEVERIRFGGESHEDVVIDYGPLVVYPQDKPERRRGSVVYDRVARVPVLWHDGLEETA